MANIGTFTAEKDGFTGTLRTLTLNVKVKLVPNDKGDTENAPDFHLQAAGHGRRSVEEDQRGRAGIPVRIHRRPFVPGDGLCPPDRERGRHARPDLVAQQAEGGLTAAYRVPPTAGRDAADRSTARAGFLLLPRAGYARHGGPACVPCGSQSVSTSGVACRRCKRRRAFGLRRQAVTAIRLQSSRLRASRAARSACCNSVPHANALRRVGLFQYRPEFLAHLCQQFISFAGAVTGISQCEQRERMHFHDLAQIGQLLDGWAFQVALQRAHVGATGHVGERFLAQTTRLPYRPNRRCQ